MCDWLMFGPFLIYDGDQGFLKFSGFLFIIWAKMFSSLQNTISANFMPIRITPGLYWKLYTTIIKLII